MNSLEENEMEKKTNYQVAEQKELKKEKSFLLKSLKAKFEEKVLPSGMFLEGLTPYWIWLFLRVKVT